jgi:hypothetical protein
LGSYGTSVSTYLRIGVFETNVPVSWSPAPEDQLYKSVKYTDTQILAVDGKIELSVTTKVNQIGVGGDNLVRYYSDTLTSYPAYNSSPVVKDGYAFETTWNSSNTSGVLTVSNRRIKDGKIPNFCYRFRMLINGVPATEDRIADKRLTTYAVSGEMYYDGDGYFYGFVKENRGTWFIHTTTTGMKGGDVIRIENFIVATGTVCPGFSPASADISFLNEKFTQSKIDIVDGKITSTVEQINSVDGKVTGLASRVTQTESSINSVVERVDDQGNRLSAAEIKLDSTSIKLGVVEGTANDAKATAGTASNKADAVDGRVTATQNGLVETGINITSRKIVLKSDNVLFQNNAGQQTAALNANGRLTANVIEAGEVVANGFAAQRITTGNLTVTDGAEIAGMSISGNRLTGGNITLTNGARIGSFQVSLNWLTGLNSSQIDLWSGANTGEGNNTLMQPGRILINQKGDNQPALEIQGKGNTLIAGKYCSLNVDTFQVTANQVRIPGVFFACSLLPNATIGKTWGSFNFHITGFRKLSTGRYTVTYTGYTGDVYIMLQPMEYTKWGCACIEPYSQGSFTYKTFDANSGLFDCAVIAYFCGMPS